MEDGIYIQRNPGLYTQLPSAEVIGSCLYPGCDFVKTPSEIRQAGYYMIEPPATVVKEPYWSASNKGFYFESMGSTIPEDAVLITEEEYKQLLADQAAGKFISSNEEGKPVAIDGSVEAEATTVKHYIQVASADTLGHIKVGEGLNITPEGMLSALVKAPGLKFSIYKDTAKDSPFYSDEEGYCRIDLSVLPALMYMFIGYGITTSTYKYKSSQHFAFNNSFPYLGAGTFSGGGIANVVPVNGGQSFTEWFDFNPWIESFSSGIYKTRLFSKDEPFYDEVRYNIKLLVFHF